MVTCQECKDRLYPENPTVPQRINDRHLKPLCYGCSQYEPSREPITVTPQPEDANHLQAQVDNLKGMLIYYRNELNELSDSKRVPSKKEPKYK